jgi:hypothetical protein
MSTRNQTADQTLKGGVLGIITYLAMKYNVDPALTALALPVLAAGLSLASTKIGDPEVAAFFGTANGKPIDIAPAAKKKAPAKKAAPKKK